jgi:protein TonB
MNETLPLQRLPDLDDPLRRLPWVTLAGIAIWVALLSVFALLLERAEPPPAELKPLEARIVELPPEIGGLSGGGAPAHALAPAIPKPKVAPAHVPPVVHQKKVQPPPMPVSPNGTATASAAPAQPPATSSGTGNGNSNSGGESGGGTGNGTGTGAGGIGSDSLGAHAMYAPVPELPDDLREETIDTVAVAHFTVSYDGQSTVALVTKTENPRLNQILLDTLKQWRFFPAMKNGVAIDSEFDLKIPITVQ